MLVERFSIGSFWGDVRHHGVTVAGVLGAMAQFLLNRPRQSDEGDNPLQRMMMVPVVEDIQQFRRRFGVEVTTCFGSTEANIPIRSESPATTLSGMGRRRPGFELRLVAPDGADVPMANLVSCWSGPRNSA